MKFQTGVFGLLLILVSGCERLGISGYRYHEGTLPTTPVNLGDINSQFDDYNSDVPSFGEVVPLIFSSKRGNRTDFDFVNEKLNYSFDRRSGKLSFNNKPYWGLDVVDEQIPLANAVQTANSPANELGPYIRSFDYDIIKDGFVRHKGQYLMLFASDWTGNLDIYLTTNYEPPVGSNTPVRSTKPFTEPVPLRFLNSAADDAYPTFEKSYKAMYFTSNRGGDFDIYLATLPDGAAQDLHSRLAGLNQTPTEKVASLNSPSDDKCPYILGDIMVFTSNRPGGFGGFDLYYSRFENGQWGAPINFGPDINSVHDEYRPILREPMPFKQRLLLFSSNRPGGKGGFDLYMVGVAK